MKIAVACPGSICRSPVADVAPRDRLRSAGRDDVETVSAGTGGRHVGERAGPRPTYDLVRAMGAANLHEISQTGDGARIRMFRDFHPIRPGDVPDPYYGGEDGFREVLTMIEPTSAAIARALTDPHEPHEVRLPRPDRGRCATEAAA